MIENIIYSVLKNDGELALLLGATAEDSRIYAVYANPLKLPCVVFYGAAPVSPNDTPWLYSQNITFEIYAETAAEYNNIRNRFYEIFQKYDRFFNSEALKTQGIIIKECHAVSAQSVSTFPEETEQGVSGVVSFDFQFTKCA